MLQPSPTKRLTQHCGPIRTTNVPFKTIKQRCRVSAQASRRDALAAGVALLSTNAVLPAEAASKAAGQAPPKPFCGIVDTVPSWAFSTPWKEDLVDFAGGKTWYRYVNYVPPAGSSGGLGGLFDSLQRRYSPAAPDKLPLLVVSGGPGWPCSYLEPLELMAGVGRQVIFYDQVGCGNTFLASNSSCPPPDQLAPELYLQQIDGLRAALQLGPFHIYGQGIGGMLALSYAASRGGKAAGISSVTLGSVPGSYKQLIQDRQAAARELLGAETSQMLLEADAAAPASSSSGAVQSAWQQYEQQYVCRFPAATAAATGCARRAQQQRSQPVFAALSGGRYFEAAGGLADWSVSSLDATALQDVPVLVTRGEFDEVAAASTQQVASALTSSGGKVLTYKGSGSFMHIDAWEPHLTSVEEHLCRAEGSPLPTSQQ